MKDIHYVDQEFTSFSHIEGKQGSTPNGYFKELMRIQESEQKQKKEKKKRQEIEEEIKADLIARANQTEQKAVSVVRCENVRNIANKSKTSEKNRSEASTLPHVGDVQESRETVQSMKITNVVHKEEDIDKKIPDRDEPGVDFKASLEPSEKPSKVPAVLVPSVTASAAPVSSCAFLSSTSATPLAYTTFPSEILELFETMVSLITVMQEKRDRQTTIEIHHHSKFSGCLITIGEFSTASGIYNVDIEGAPEHVAIFEKHLPDLMRAFANGGYKFKVHRIDAKIKLSRPSAHPIVERKGDLADG